MTRKRRRYIRAVSLKGTTHARLAAYARSIGATLNGLVDRWATEALDAAGAAVPEPPPPLLGRPDMRRSGGGVREF